MLELQKSITATAKTWVKRLHNIPKRLQKTKSILLSHYNSKIILNDNISFKKCIYSIEMNFKRILYFTQSISRFNYTELLHNIQLSLIYTRYLLIFNLYIQSCN